MSHQRVLLERRLDLARFDPKAAELQLRVYAPAKFNRAIDLVARVLRTPSDPRRTLDDDPLRILRVIRFAARFGFTVDADLAAACVEFAARLDIVAAERRTDELRKILGLGGERCVTAFSRSMVCVSVTAPGWMAVVTLSVDVTCAPAGSTMALNPQSSRNTVSLTRPSKRGPPAPSG